MTRDKALRIARSWFETRTRDPALEYGELVAQHEDLGIFGTVASTA